MDKPRIHYPRTTPSQRKVLFQQWEKTGDREAACRAARVSEGTFYYWRPRFEAGRYEAVGQVASHAPQAPRRTAEAIAQEVIRLRQENAQWGKQRIADELAKKNNWERVISPNTVRRILTEAGLWRAEETSPQSAKFEPKSRTAEKPGQTFNIDLCFVPAEHEPAVKLPAVSGSSGRLVVERAKEVGADYPGAVFGEETLEYEAAMIAFVAASKANAEAAKRQKGAVDPQQLSVTGQKRQLRQQEKALAGERGQSRQRRQQEDTAWQALRRHRQEQLTARQQALKSGIRPAWGSRKAQDEPWGHLREQRREQLSQRDQEDERWRQKRLDLHTGLSDLGLVSQWVAILVMVDNCTRQCVELPLFWAGPHLTAERVVEALETLLPADLQFLVTDRGTHFTAKLFEQLEAGHQFLHVQIARHRPQSNGIAERLVRTLKEWLADKVWSSEPELAQLLADFIAEYNDRPHQGLPWPGLSPNEFANRVWLL